MLPSSQPFQHAVIVGAGLLGTSFGLALRKNALALTLTAVTRPNSPAGPVALAKGAVHHLATDLAAAVRGSSSIPPADLVVLCTPIRQFPELLQSLAPALARNTLVTDVGSTKAEILHWAANLLPDHTFVGSHPMAGSEKSGPEAARDDLYQNAVCLVCPPLEITPETPAAIDRITALWQTLGMRVIQLPGDQHDRWVATISHLPHALAFALVNAAAKNPAMLQAVAGGFLDTTRVASSDPTMWTDIFLTNRDAILDAMASFESDWAQLKNAIITRDEPAIRDLLSAARTTRDDLLAQRSAAGLANRASKES